MKTELDKAIESCPFCGVMPIPEIGKVLYELHHKPNCFIGGRIEFGASELERWNNQPAATRLQAVEKERDELREQSGLHHQLHQSALIELSQLHIEYKKALEEVKRVRSYCNHSGDYLKIEILNAILSLPLAIAVMKGEA